MHSVSYFTLRAASYRGLRDGSRDKRRERGGGHATRRFACRWQERLPRLIGGDFGRSLSHEQRVRINSSSSVEHYSGKSDRSLGAPHPEETANRTPILSQLQLPTGLVQKITSGVQWPYSRTPRHYSVVELGIIDDEVLTFGDLIAAAFIFGGDGRAGLFIDELLAQAIAGGLADLGGVWRNSALIRFGESVVRE